MTHSVVTTNPYRIDRWNPYIAVQNSTGLSVSDLASEVLRAALVDKAIRKSIGIVAALYRKEISSLPLAVQSLDQETDGFLTRRIVNMVAAFGRFLSQPQHADVREKLAPIFWPIPGWVHGQYCVTSPALLVLHAILYSHIEWFREHLFEAHSAARAFEELKSQGFPTSHCRFVAALIAHQTLLRAAWSSDDESDPKEVLAFHKTDTRALAWVGEAFVDTIRGRLEADRAVGWAVARTLFPFVSRGRNSEDAQRDAISNLKRQLASALVLHSLCLSSRHHRSESERLPAYKAQALSFLDHLLNTETGPGWREPSLTYLQYGRYVHLMAPDLLRESKSAVLERESVSVPQGGKDKPCQNITVSFKRVSSLRVWDQQEFHRCDLREYQWLGAQSRSSKPGSDNIWKLIEPTVGRAYRYALDPCDYLLSALGVK